MVEILFLEGPNLNLTGRRETSLYGRKTAATIQTELTRRFAERCRLHFFQSNHEGALIDKLHAVAVDDAVVGIVVNPGGLTHTSVSLRDALVASEKPFVEVHLSNVYRREPFRRRSYFSDVAVGVVAGFGPRGYSLAVDALLDHVEASGAGKA